MQPADIVQARALVDEIYVDDKVRNYIVDLVMATRDPGTYGLEIGDLIQYGGSPRATINLTLAAKAMAVLERSRLCDAAGRQRHRARCTPTSRHHHVRSGSGRQDVRGCGEVDPRSRSRAVRSPSKAFTEPLTNKGFPMIPRDLMKRIRRIQIRTSHLADDMLSGQYHSAFKGRGIEFEEVRPYQIGDDVRSIDWNVTARYGDPFVKLFREERELTVMLLVDLSASQSLGTHYQTKRELVTELGATLAFSAIKNNDKVGLHLFTDGIEKVVPASKGSRHVLRVIRELLYCEPIGRGTNLTTGLAALEQDGQASVGGFSDQRLSGQRLRTNVAHRQTTARRDTGRGVGSTRADDAQCWVRRTAGPGNG